MVKRDSLLNAAAAIVLVILGAVIVVGVQNKNGTHTASSFLNPMARAEDRAAQSDLRNALTAEKTEYTDTQVYTANVATLKGIESSLDWGGRLQVVVGHALVDGDTVCMSEASQSGTTFAIADIAAGQYAGTYFGRTTCPPGVPASVLGGWPSAWDGISRSTISWGTAPTAPSSEYGNVAQQCTIEGQTFETALQAYYAQNQRWPAGSSTYGVAYALVQAGLLQDMRLGYYGKWTYNPATHNVDTSGC